MWCVTAVTENTLCGWGWSAMVAPPPFLGVQLPQRIDRSLTHARTFFRPK